MTGFDRCRRDVPPSRHELRSSSAPIDEQTGRLIGAISDLQAARVRDLVAAAGQRFDYHSFPDMPHSMHGHDPKLYVETVLAWVSTLDR